MKKIAVNTVKAFLKENKREDTYIQTFTVGDSTFDVVLHTTLTVDEKSTFINRVISGCFDMSGKFRPEYVSPMFRATILQMCTNIPAMTLRNEVDQGGAPTFDIDVMNDLYSAMKLDAVENAGYQAMLDEMADLCERAIEWKKSSLLAEHQTDSALRRLLDTLNSKVDGMDFGSLMRYAGQLSEATKGMGEGDIVRKLIELKDYQAEN